MNDHRRRQEQAARERYAFLQGVAEGRIRAVDRFGSPIAEHDTVLVHFPYDIPCEVVSISPVLDPNQPAGLLQLALTVTIPWRGMAQQPDPGLVLLRRSAAPGPGVSEGVGLGPDVPPPPPLVPFEDPSNDGGHTSDAGEDQGQSGDPGDEDDHQGQTGPRLVLTDAPDPHD